MLIYSYDSGLLGWINHSKLKTRKNKQANETDTKWAITTFIRKLGSSWKSFTVLWIEVIFWFDQCGNYNSVPFQKRINHSFSVYCWQNHVSFQIWPVFRLTFITERRWSRTRLMILMKVSNTGFRASNSFWLKVWLQILIFWLFNFFKFMVQRLIRVTKDNVVTVLIFVKVFTHNTVMVYVRSPSLI